MHHHHLADSQVILAEQCPPLDHLHMPVVSRVVQRKVYVYMYLQGDMVRSYLSYMHGDVYILSHSCLDLSCIRNALKHSIQPAEARSILNTPGLMIPLWGGTCEERQVDTGRGAS